ncbi:MAG: glycosyltransferase family 1 protein [Candidatus Hydrothermales bacterium]
MKIFVDTTPLKYTLSGIQIFTINLVNELKKRGEKVIEIKKPFLRLLFEKGDIYLGPDGRIPYFKKFKLLTTIIHDICFETNPELFPPKAIEISRKKVKKALDRSDIVFVPSKFTRENIIKFYGFEEKIEVIYPGVKIVKNQKKVENIKENFFLFVGVVQKRKNLVNLIRAFKELNLKNYYLLLAGKEGFGYEEVEQEIDNKTTLWFRKIFDQSEIFYLYEKCIALVFPSFCEGFGLPILEAISLKKPVIASPLSVFKEYAGENLFYLKGFDKEDIKEGIIKFLEEKKENIEIKVNKAYERVKNFTWENTVLNMLKKWKEKI